VFRSSREGTNCVQPRVSRLGEDIERKSILESQRRILDTHESSLYPEIMWLVRRNIDVGAFD